MAYRDPFREMESLRREFDRIFNAIEQWTFPFSRVSFLPGRSARQYPMINLNEDKDNYYVEALAPGVNPKTIDLSLANNCLTISGEKLVAGAGIEVKPEAYHRSERACGKFTRTIELPSEVDADKVKADYQNGLLLVTLPKSEKAKPKQITVNVG
ncbi:MAG: Hsp20/alpha crystallin family protein [bacterium]|nr:Hsp20/alpha crystallin family protein [bacterium]